MLSSTILDVKCNRNSTDFRFYTCDNAFFTSLLTSAVAGLQTNGHHSIRNFMASKIGRHTVVHKLLTSGQSNLT